MPQKLLERLSPYTDEFGLIHSNAPGNWTLNGLSYTALAYILAQLRGENPRWQAYRHSVRICMSDLPGEFMLFRRPGNTDQNSWDDYTSTAAGLSVLGCHETAAWMLTYYRRKWWYLNNEKPGTFERRDGGVNFSAYLGRFPQMRFSYHVAAQKCPSLLLQVAWAAGVVKAASAELTAQGTHRMAYVQCMGYRASTFRSWICTRAVNHYLRTVKKRWGNIALTQVGYFAPGHPLLEEWPMPEVP